MSDLVIRRQEWTCSYRTRAHWWGKGACPKLTGWPGSQCGGDGGQRPRQACDAATAAWTGAARLQRQRLRESKGTDSWQGAQRARFCESAHASQRHSRRGGALQEPQQVADSGSRRTRIRRGQAALGLHEGALSRARKECKPRLRCSGAGQCLSVPHTIDGTGAPAMGENRAPGSPTRASGL